MTTKTEIKTAVRNAYTLNPDITDWSEIEDALIDNVDSILEGVYSASVADDETLETYTTSNANFDYNISFRKVGSQVTMTGRFTANTTLSQVSAIIFSITNTDLLQESGSDYYVSAIKLTEQDTLPLLLSGNSLRTSSSILSGEGFRFTITYNTEN